MDPYVNEFKRQNACIAMPDMCIVREEQCVRGCCFYHYLTNDHRTRCVLGMLAKVKQDVDHFSSPKIMTMLQWRM